MQAPEKAFSEVQHRKLPTIFILEEFFDQADSPQKYQHAVMPAFTSASDRDGQKAYVHPWSRL